MAINGMVVNGCRWLKLVINGYVYKWGYHSAHGVISLTYKWYNSGHKCISGLTNWQNPVGGGPEPVDLLTQMPLGPGLPNQG